MKLIHMLQDWDRTEDETGRHVLTTGNTFPVTDTEAKSAVDGGFAEYVGGEPTGDGKAVVDGVNTVKPTMRGTGKGPSRAKKDDEPNKGLASGSGSGGEPSPNVVSTPKAKRGGSTSTEAPDVPNNASGTEDAPA